MSNDKSGSTCKSPGTQPKFENYTSVESICNGIPVYSFNNITYVYGESPDFYPGVIIQGNNSSAISKIKLKKSWEIKHNFAGCESEMTPRTWWNESQPMLPVHLIDGNPDTIWSSWKCEVPESRQEWIRIDLPVESMVSTVSLVCKKKYLGRDWHYGKSLPKELEVKISRDAWHWDTIFKSDDIKACNPKEPGTDIINEIQADSCLSHGYLEGNADDPDIVAIGLNEPMPAKQIWIVGDQLKNQFSIGAVEVLDEKGNNLALISRGAGVMVSSVDYGQWSDKYTQDSLWAPLLYDLGNKWVRFGCDNGSVMWCYTEHEKGRLEVDKRLDEIVTELAENGVNIILCIDFKGNWIYENPPRKTNWFEARFREMNDLYNSQRPAPADSSSEMFEAYLRYVEYIVRHFKDRVTYFEIGNEWNTLTVNHYMKNYFEPVYDVIKRLAPDSKIMLGGTTSCVNKFGEDYPWHELINCLSPGATLRDGMLAASGRTMLAAKNININDAIVSVDARSEAQTGIVLRYKGDHDFLVAAYDPQSRQIFFSEMVSGGKYYYYEWDCNYYMLAEDNRLDVKPAEGLDSVVHLEARMEGPEVTLTVSDGKKTFTTSHKIEKVQSGGSAGIMHCPWRPQSMTAEGYFRNFCIQDLSDNAILKDEFNGTGISMEDWDIFWNHWGCSTKLPAAHRVDAVGFHPFAPVDKKYFDNVRAFREDCIKHGFKGEYFASEIYAGSAYPPGPVPAEGDLFYKTGDLFHTTEFKMAKYLISSLVGHSGMNIEAGPCHQVFTGYQHPQALCRTTWPVQTIVPCQPTPSYYCWRNAATAMDDFYEADFPVTFSDDTDLIYFTLQSGDKRRLMLALWLSTELSDKINERRIDVTFPDINSDRVSGVDIFNGTEQQLDVCISGKSTLLKGIFVKDYPILITIEVAR